MEAAMDAADAAISGSILLVAALLLPQIGLLLSLALGGRHVERVAFTVIPLCFAVAIAIAAQVILSGRALVYFLGGWLPPLGLALRADGLSAAMMVTTAVVMGATALFARPGFRQARGEPEARPPLMFWTLFLGVWGAMNLVLLGEDLFTLYVALELLTFAAVPMVSLDGRAETIAAALRYLLFALMGSLLYLLGVALLYGSYGSLDILQLSTRIRPEPAAMAAAALMTAGLLAKTALFPLHLWLPPAHAGAPPPASAVLSALVVKGSFFLLLRLWFDAMPGLMSLVGAQILATLGAAAILFGSVLALRQARLKLLIAYSTVAQIGYLFLIFPLAAGSAWAEIGVASVLTGGMLQVVSHACAKAAMFLAAGLMAERLGHDRIAELGGIARVLPMTVISFGLAGLSLMGVPPSGGFTAKWLLLMAAVQTGQWWWATVIVLGGLLTGSYVFQVLAAALTGGNRQPMPGAPAASGREAIVLFLALCSVLLGLIPFSSFKILHIGRFDMMAGLLP
jgi:formate hydrogenlyase subunit 3/multisubunit Na+/H+ antiporter MnhD subunit